MVDTEQASGIKTDRSELNEFLASHKQTKREQLVEEREKIKRQQIEEK